MQPGLHRTRIMEKRGLFERLSPQEEAIEVRKRAGIKDEPKKTKTKAPEVPATPAPTPEPEVVPEPASSPAPEAPVVEEVKTQEVPAPTAEEVKETEVAPDKAEMKALRAEYKTVTGKNAFNAWTAEEVKQKIEEFKQQA